MKKYFLIVEDAPDLRALLKELFEGDGFTIQTATNGLEALNFLKAAHDLPSFILLDLMMPVMDGFEFRLEQEKDPRLSSIPVFVMTADSHFESKTTKIGANGYVKKPIENIESMLKTARQYCP